LTFLAQGRGPAEGKAERRRAWIRETTGVKISDGDWDSGKSDFCLWKKLQLLKARKGPE